MMHDLGWLKRIKILNVLGNIINPATDEKLDELKTVLSNIYSAVDELEIKTDQISIDAGQINLNTDELETKIQSVRNQLDVLLSTRATETTQLEIKNYLDTVETKLQSLIDKDFSTETTLKEVRDYLDTVETKLQSMVSSLDVNLSTRASEITLGDVKTNTNTTNTKIGEVQETPTQYSLLARLKDVWDKLNSLFTDGLAKIKLWDGTNTLLITPTGRLKVEIIPTDNNIQIQLNFNDNHSAANKYQWQKLLEYTVPTGYDLNAISFNANSSVSGEKVRLIDGIFMGSFFQNTNTFVDGEAVILPKFYSRFYLLVTSPTSVDDDIVTITYTNEIGISGRTATATIPKNSIAKTCIEILLQSGDNGIINITNITHSIVGGTGIFEFYGVIELFYLTLDTALIQYNANSISLGGIVVPEGKKICMQYKAESTSSNLRRVSFLGTLIKK